MRKKNTHNGSRGTGSGILNYLGALFFRIISIFSTSSSTIPEAADAVNAEHDQTESSSTAHKDGDKRKAHRLSIDVSLKYSHRKKFLESASGFSFHSALRDSYKNKSNLYGHQFLIDMHRCDWCINETFYPRKNVSAHIEELERTLKPSSISNLDLICQGTYGVSQDVFLRRFRERCLAVATLQKMFRDDCHGVEPNIRLLDEIASHCHQGGLSAWICFDVVWPVKCALDEKYFFSNAGATLNLQNRLYVTACSNIKHVEAITPERVAVSEDLQFLLKVPQSTEEEETPEFKVNAVLKYDISIQGEKRVRYDNCSLSLTIITPPDCNIKASQSLLFRTCPPLGRLLLKLKHWFYSRGIFTPKDTNVPGPTLVHVQRIPCIDMNVTKLHYEMPPLQVSPEEFFSDLIKNSTLGRTLYRDCSKEHVLGVSQSQQSFQDASLQLDTTSISDDLVSESTTTKYCPDDAPSTTLAEGSIASLQEALSVEPENGGRSA
ncbi:hypothetical protein [Anaplasma phagocytophilum]|uniref:Uncharacterized protein n=1 Tax=Anaplasma phagocytophilum str. CRT38 TaxID=1269275 RepID=S6GAM7_ANAPH|nr:hypothetical protein [Anaplasma phagocytophilum]EOA62347.1 hypothetical protein CRT38_03742 [Anaplasma phagocytophilum str. CRT38]